MSVEGLEPPTNSLKGYCSTIELHAHLRVGFYHAGVLKSTGEGERCAFRRRTGDRRPGKRDRGPVCLIPSLIKILIDLLLTIYLLLLLPIVISQYWVLALVKPMDMGAGQSKRHISCTIDRSEGHVFRICAPSANPV